MISSRSDWGEALGFLVQDRRTFGRRQLIAAGPLPALRRYLGLPRDPDGVSYGEPLFGPRALRDLLLDLPVPVGLVYGKFDLEDRGLILLDVHDGADLDPTLIHVRLTQDVRLYHRTKEESHRRDG
jgi:hypothetical protein